MSIRITDTDSLQDTPDPVQPPPLEAEQTHSQFSTNAGDHKDTFKRSTVIWFVVSTPMLIVNVAICYFFAGQSGIESLLGISILMLGGSMVLAELAAIVFLGLHVFERAIRLISMSVFTLFVLLFGSFFAFIAYIVYMFT